MRQKEFDRIVNELFEAVLARLGFTNKQSRGCTFWRNTSDDIYHIIQPIMLRDGAWYYVAVYPSSAKIDPLFAQRFPDSLGWPSDSYSYLGHKGVGLTQHTFGCKYEENLRRVFEREVKPLLLNVAVPYLDGIQTTDDLLPVIKSSTFLGFALYHVGRIEEAREALLKERERLLRLDTSNEDVAALLAATDELLQKITKS